MLFLELFIFYFFYFELRKTIAIDGKLFFYNSENLASQLYNVVHIAATAAAKEQ